MASPCYASWGRKSLTFSQLEDVVNMWFKDTAEFERIFLNAAQEVMSWERLVERNQDKIAPLVQNVEELRTIQRSIECEVFDLCCDLPPLEDQVLKDLECILGCPEYFDCGKLCLYSAVESLFCKVNNLRQLSEELTSLMETQQVISKVVTVLSLDEKILRGLIPKIEEIENLCLKNSEQHACLPVVPAENPLFTSLLGPQAGLF